MYTLVGIQFALLSLLGKPSLHPTNIALNRAGETELSIIEHYASIDFGDIEKTPFDLFNRGLTGYSSLREAKKLSDKEIVTLIDFRKSANEKRLWIIDLKNNRVLKHTLVAHGRNSGEEYATKFSNVPNSNQSSLGFYVTGAVYIGKHGTSLKLHGVENGINDNAEKRAIVMHAADYVSDTFVKKVGRLGRSLGCPAVPVDEHKEIINTIEGGTCLFILHSDETYLSKTTIVVNESFIFDK